MEILLIIVAVLVALWVIGLVAKVAGGLIHLVLVVALVVLGLALLMGNRS